MNAKSKEHYISDENKLKKRLNKRSLYVQSLRTPIVDKNAQIESSNMHMPIPIQMPIQIQQVGSSGVETKNIVNIINSLTNQISYMATMFSNDGTIQKPILTLYKAMGDSFTLVISKIKVLFNELRDAYELFLQTINPNKKDQFVEIRNSIIKYFEFWNAFWNLCHIGIVLKPSLAPLDPNEKFIMMNEYIYNNLDKLEILKKYDGRDIKNIYDSTIKIFAQGKFANEESVIKVLLEIKYNYNDTLKIIYDTLGPFIDKLKINNREIYKNIPDAEHEKAQLIKDKAIKEQEINDYKNNEIDKTQQSINMFTIGIPNAEKELKDQKNKIIASTKKIYDIFKNEHLDKITANAYVILVRQKHHTPEEADTLKRITDLLSVGDLLNVEGHMKDIDVSEVEIQKANAFLNTAYDELKNFTNKKFEQVAVLRKLENELYKINQQILLVENYINKKKTNEDYTPKKGSGRGQSIKHIPKKGSGRSQYVDPYDRSIPKRYM